jgi:hypothetical protein
MAGKRMAALTFASLICGRSARAKGDVPVQLCHEFATSMKHCAATFARDIKSSGPAQRGCRVIDNRKQAVSIRMSTSDVRKVKKLSLRLGVRDSDVIRFAVKSMLARLGPLYDGEVRGRNLVPVFVESGGELLRYFDLDALRLDNIINEGADRERRVDSDDIALLAMTGLQQNYALLRLSSLGQSEGDRNGNNGNGKELAQSLRHYLYDKYVYQQHGNRRPRDGEAGGGETPAA